LTGAGFGDVIRPTCDRASGAEPGMRRIFLVVLLALAVCATADAAGTVKRSSGPQEWRLPTGLPPSEAEYDVLVAACQGRAHDANDAGKIDACLTNEFGLRHSQ
jgi:hypothetical protein